MGAKNVTKGAIPTDYTMRRAFSIIEPLVAAAARIYFRCILFCWKKPFHLAAAAALGHSDEALLCRHELGGRPPASSLIICEIATHRHAC